MCIYCKIIVKMCVKLKHFLYLCTNKTYTNVMNVIATIKAQVAQLKSACPEDETYPILEALVDEVGTLQKRSFKKYLTLKEACGYTGYSKNKMYALVRDNKIPYSKPEEGGSGKLFFSTDDLDEYMSRNRVSSTYDIEAKAAGYVAANR